ncbi:flavin reductase [Streptomyces viridiviolaceus]|uniref:Flavin reductase n=1 Tax=Streptomyces viridiviolaceus TaxID=68282 RepID=A0ABW2EDF5_9ACTN|nr:flavin reductase family protein [Streptomyces viridiviolaceus]GHB73809.1 flavin reductase [Streptomyces viridiviolaceus]
MREPSDSRWFREVLGQYPTGVCVVTAVQADGSRAGFVVGSFTSVSLDPPLVAFFPDKGSTSWPKIEKAGRFCVNILSADQEHLCRQFASKAEDKFQGVAVRAAGSGSPVIEGVVAWIDCDLESVQEAGDHYIVLGRVRELDVEDPQLPLLFFQGGYGRFAPLSLAAPGHRGALTEQLRKVDLVRPAMESLAADLSARCIATAVVDDELVVLASSGSPDAGARATLVGVHLPFAPPNGSALAASYDEGRVEAWLKTLPEGTDRDEHRRRLDRVRERGYSVGLLNEAQRKFASVLDRLAADPRSMKTENLRSLVTRLNYDPADLSSDAKRAIRVIAVPVPGVNGEADLAFTLYGFSKPDANGGIDAYIDRVREAGRQAASSLNGHAPAGV